MAAGPAITKTAESRARIHPTARIETGVSIGDHSAIWDHAHIRSRTVLGHHCIVGEKTYIAYDVRIGNYVKINSFVYIPTGVTIHDRVMVSAGCIFINDKYPRAYDTRQQGLASSEPNEETLRTHVLEGSTIGAASTILGGLEIGRYAMVGAGSVVTRSVADHALVIGNPARAAGWVCFCGQKLSVKKNKSKCSRCGEGFILINQRLAAMAGGKK